jgi:hypothetical protein
MRKTATALLALGLLLLGAPTRGEEESPALELYSNRGCLPSVKLYSGERLTFRVREKRVSVGGLFGDGVDLSDVEFHVEPWPPPEPSPIMIIQGRNAEDDRFRRSRKVGDSYALDCPYRPGRYKLIAEKEGYRRACVVIYAAQFALLRMRHSIRPWNRDDPSYWAAFEVGITDQFEERDRIPIRIECLDEDRRVIDVRDDVIVLRKRQWPARFLSNFRIRISNTVVEGFRDRVERLNAAGFDGDSLHAKIMRIRKFGYLRISFDQLSFTYRLPLGPRPR